MARIGIFGGAFNPVHNGHLALAENYLDALSLDRIIFIPTSIPPHKSAEHLIAGEDRMNMLRLAIKGKDNFEVSDIEFKRQGKSYSVDTLTELKKFYHSDELYLIVGSDQFFYFQKWYKADEILKMATVVTAARENNEYNLLNDFKSHYENMKNTVISNFNVISVSSSQVRERVNSAQSIDDLVPSAVAEYIRDKKLYV